MVAPTLEPLGTEPVVRAVSATANDMTDRTRLEEATREGWITAGPTAPIAPVVRQRGVARVQDVLDEDRG